MDARKRLEHGARESTQTLFAVCHACTTCPFDMKGILLDLFVDHFGPSGQLSLYIPVTGGYSILSEDGRRPLELRPRSIKLATSNHSFSVGLSLRLV